MNAWSTIQYVGTGLSLVAFAIAAVLFAYRARLQQRADLILSARKEERLAAILATAEAFHVDVSGLSERHRQEIVLAQIKLRARRELLFAAVVLIVAILPSAVAIVSIIAPVQPSVPQSDPTPPPRPPQSGIMPEDKIFEGRWITVNPPIGESLIFIRSGSSALQVAVPLLPGPARLVASDGRAGSSVAVRGTGFDCYYYVVQFGPNEMNWDFKSGDSACPRSMYLRKERPDR
jgi:hypothetical protein